MRWGSLGRRVAEVLHVRVRVSFEPQEKGGMRAAEEAAFHTRRSLLVTVFSSLSHSSLVARH